MGLHPLPAIAIFSHLLLTSNLTFNGVSTVSKQKEFDYFVLSLQWPGTNCRESQKCCSTNACCRGANAPTEFTIHGLWPNYNDGSWPSCCSNSDFDMKEIVTLQSGLEKYWPSLSCSSPSTCDGHKGSFWAHEWEKHGTCAYPVIKNEYDYFRTTLNLYQKYNVTKVLTEAGYVPSDSAKYPIGGIISAIENAFHMTPSVICYDYDVEELYLCFDKNFKPQDCVTSSSLREVVDASRSSCPKFIRLPTDPSSSSGQAIQAKHRVWILALFIIAICL